MPPDRIKLENAAPRRTAREQSQTNRQAAERAWEEWYQDVGHTCHQHIENDVIRERVRDLVRVVFIDGWLMGHGFELVHDPQPRTPPRMPAGETGLPKFHNHYER